MFGASRPPPTPPYWPAYEEPERSRIKAAYEADCEAFQKEITTQFIISAIFVLTALVGICFAAFMGPDIIIDMIKVLAQ